MKKKTCKFVLYSISGLMLLTSGYYIKRCKDDAKNYTKKVEGYISDFVDDDFLIAAHRGYSSLAVENTKEAISLASNAPYIDYIEMDARLTSDNHLVLAHNNLVTNKYHESIKISQENYEFLATQNLCYKSKSLSIELKNLFNKENGNILTTRTKKLNFNHYQLSSLKEGLDACQNKKILLDLKFQNNTKDFVDALDEELEKLDTNDIIFQSSDLLSLLYLQNRHPDYDCLAIIKNKSDLDYAPLFNNLGIRKNLIEEQLIEELIQDKKTIAVWTVNDPKEINCVIDHLGSNYKNVIYISDYPDVVAKCLNDKEEKKLVKEKSIR